MRLFKNSETGVADWFVKTSSPTLPSITSEEASRIVSMPPAMNEDLLDAEMTVVEKCASVKRPYFYNRAWDARSVASLREMCLACNCTMCETSPDDETAKAKAAKTKEETKTAMSKVSSTLTSASGMVIPSSSMKIDLGDTFHLDSVKERPAKADWQKNSAAQKLEKPNTMAGSHSIAKIGGGEDFFLSPHLFTKPGQNSVTNPMAIQALAESKEDSPKQKLVKDKEDKEIQERLQKLFKRLIYYYEMTSFNSVTGPTIQEMDGFVNVNLFYDPVSVQQQIIVKNKKQNTDGSLSDVSAELAKQRVIDIDVPEAFVCEVTLNYWPKVRTVPSM